MDGVQSRFCHKCTKFHPTENFAKANHTCAEWLSKVRQNYVSTKVPREKKTEKKKGKKKIAAHAAAAGDKGDDDDDVAGGASGGRQGARGGNKPAAADARTSKIAKGGDGDGGGGGMKRKANERAVTKVETAEVDWWGGSFTHHARRLFRSTWRLHSHY